MCLSLRLGIRWLQHRMAWPTKAVPASAIVISDSVRFCHPLQTHLTEEQSQLHMDNFHNKVMLLRAGMSCGFLPRHMPARGLPRANWWKKSHLISPKRRSRDDLAQCWWREMLLTPPPGNCTLISMTHPYRSGKRRQRQDIADELAFALSVLPLANLQ